MKKFNYNLYYFLGRRVGITDIQNTLIKKNCSGSGYSWSIHRKMFLTASNETGGFISMSLCQLQNSYVTYSDKKLTSLPTYGSAQTHRILCRIIRCLSQYNFRTSHHPHIRRFVKENNDSNKTYRNVHDLSLYQVSFVKMQWFMSYLQKIRILTFYKPQC
jgi:hypothetical protein